MSIDDTSPSSSVLLIYTGGTIGMIENPSSGMLEAFDFEYIEKHVPEIKRFSYAIDTISFDPVIDSSDMGPDCWVRIVEIIHKNYDRYDGFVVLHGTDTMAHTASALSFMLENLAKPVVLTGSQLPIGKLRTDGKENLITSIEIAAAKNKEGRPYVAEVCVLFDDLLLRGNRSTKMCADLFEAFSSPNLPPLAEVGIDIHYNRQILLSPPGEGTPLKIHTQLDPNVMVLKLFPGLSRQVVHSILHTEGLRGVVLETYGSGNAPGQEWFVHEIRSAVERGIIVVNVTQCQVGTVEMQRYETGNRLLRMGVISGYDSTSEAMVAKLMFLLGLGLSTEEIKKRMESSIVGEISPDKGLPYSPTLSREYMGGAGEVLLPRYNELSPLE